MKQENAKKTAGLTVEDRIGHQGVKGKKRTLEGRHLTSRRYLGLEKEKGEMEEPVGTQLCTSSSVSYLVGDK